MGWSFGVTSLHPDEVGPVRAFASAHGSRSDGPLDEAWWAAAKDPRSLEIRGSGSSYAAGEAAAQILEDLADTWLWMRDWKAAHRPPSRLVVVPFGFWLDGHPPEAVTELALPDGARLLVVEPIRLLDHWPGYADPSYEERSAAAWARVRSAGGFSTPTTDEGWETLHLGLHRWIWELARAAWDARLPWSIAW